MTRSRKKALIIAGAAALLVAAVGGYFLYQYWYLSNFREVLPGKVYRSGQPSPDDLRGWVRRYGIRTIINLRGDAGEETADEVRAAKELGVECVTVNLSANRLPSQASIVRLVHILDDSPKPILVHCLNGQDRSGAVSAMAAMILGEQSYAQAREQLNHPWIRTARYKYHINDMFKMYDDYCAAGKLNPEDWRVFRAWAMDGYDPPKIRGMTSDE